MTQIKDYHKRYQASGAFRQILPPEYTKYGKWKLEELTEDERASVEASKQRALGMVYNLGEHGVNELLLKLGSLLNEYKV